jgi:hypothetical protein
MKLPKEKYKKADQKSYKWLVILCIFTLVVSLVSVGLCAVALSGMPNEIDSYVQAHKEELKGEKGDTGPEGPRGFTGAAGLNGSNSYSPTHCSSYGFDDYVSTNCY